MKTLAAVAVVALVGLVLLVRPPQSDQDVGRIGAPARAQPPASFFASPEEQAAYAAQIQADIADAQRTPLQRLEAAAGPRARSGGMGRWRVRCLDDRTTMQRRCQAELTGLPHGNAVAVNIDGITFGTGSTPHENLTLPTVRPERNPEPFTYSVRTGWSASSRAMLTSVIASDRVHVAYTNWPYQERRQYTFDTAGLLGALREVDRRNRMPLPMPR